MDALETGHDGVGRDIGKESVRNPAKLLSRPVDPDRRCARRLHRGFLELTDAFEGGLAALLLGMERD
jgi:hypothetical protein